MVEVLSSAPVSAALPATDAPAPRDPDEIARPISALPPHVAASASADAEADDAASIRAVVDDDEPAPDPAAVLAGEPESEPAETVPDVDVDVEMTDDVPDVAAELDLGAREAQAHDAPVDDDEAAKMKAAEAALADAAGVRVYYDPKGVYLLPADDGELSRLTLQHHLITIHMDHKLVLPEIEWAEGDEVLDSGTGTGSWVIDTQPRVPPFVRFTGVDISPRLFPEPYNAPPNASFVQCSSLELPPHLAEDKFALINQRMLLGGFTAALWDAAPRAFLRALRPGGWAQLTEATMHTGGPATARHMRILHALFAARGLRIDIAAPGALAGLLSAAGFVNVVELRRRADLGAWAGELGALGRRNVVAGYRAMKAPIVASGLAAAGDVYSEDEYEALMDEMARELDETPGSGMEWVCVYGQKPL